MKDKTKRINYQENESGIPYVEPPEKLKVNLSISEDEVLIEGNAESLEFLAAVFAAVSDKKGYNEHIDSEIYQGFRGRGKMLTIANLD